MFANFTEETCTGTEATLELAGATTGRIQFSKSFADGDLVSYVVEDSGGTILVAGIGTYVSATDDITRNDTWNWNGTSVDNNPSSNITLSGGTHTVRCDIIDDTTSVTRKIDNPTRFGRIFVGENINEIHSGSASQTVDELNMVAHVFSRPIVVKSIILDVQGAGTSGDIAKIGIWRSVDSRNSGKVLFESSSILVDATGIKVITISNLILKAGVYLFGCVTDSTTATFKDYGDPTGAGPYGADSSNNQNNAIKGDIGVGWQTGAIGDAPIESVNQTGPSNMAFITINRT